jgi:phosphonate transport system permease protein
VKRAATAGAVCAVLALCFIGAGVRPAFDARALGEFAAGLFPPDLSPPFLRVVGLAVLRTLGIAVAGTVLSLVAAIPLGLLASPSLTRRGPLLAGERTGLASVSLAAASIAAQGLLRFLRAVPDLVWALLFVVGFGLGPLPGALALAVNSAGVLGRVYADLFEAVPPTPVLALHASGASRLQVFAAAIWPQAAGMVAAYTLYSFECCVRAAAVLGFVGAGGIGGEINLSMRLFEYGQVLTLISAFVVLVLVTDAVSRRLRGRFQRNAVHGSGLLRAPVEATHPGRTVPALVWVALLLLAFQQAGFLGAAAPGLLARFGRFAAQLFPPDLSAAFLGSLVEPLWQTVAISVVGTAIGIALGALLALPATGTLSLDDRDRPGRFGRAARVTAWSASRAVLALLRSIPELVWVLVAILAVGVGAFAGALALGLHTAGVLGKLYAETLEEVPDRPVEELRAAGATRLQRLLWAMWPQARETLLSYTLLRWDTNLRVSTVVGLVGGGGLGLVLYNAVQLGFYQRAATIVLLIWLLVTVTDFLADRLRRPAATPDAPPASALELVSAASGTPAAP